MRHTTASFVWPLLAFILPVSAQSTLAPPATEKVDYEKQVKPLLAENCYSCHGEDKQQSGLRLDLRQNALRGGDYGPVIIPGKSAESKLIRKLVDGDGGKLMPPSGELAPSDIGMLRRGSTRGRIFGMRSWMKSHPNQSSQSLRRQSWRPARDNVRCWRRW